MQQSHDQLTNNYVPRKQFDDLHKQHAAALYRIQSLEADFEQSQQASAADLKSTEAHWQRRIDSTHFSYTSYD